MNSAEVKIWDGEWRWWLLDERLEWGCNIHIPDFLSNSSIAHARTAIMGRSVQLRAAVLFMAGEIFNRGLFPLTFFFLWFHSQLPLWLSDDKCYWAHRDAAQSSSIALVQCNLTQWPPSGTPSRELKAQVLPQSRATGPNSEGEEESDLPCYRTTSDSS